MRIKSELIRIVTVHTECALTAIRFEFTFSQSTSIGGLKPDSLQITSFSRYCACSYICAIEQISENLGKKQWLVAGAAKKRQV